MLERDLIPTADLQRLLDLDGQRTPGELVAKEYTDSWRLEIVAEPFAYVYFGGDEDKRVRAEFLAAAGNAIGPLAREVLALRAERDRAVKSSQNAHAQLRAEGIKADEAQHRIMQRLTDAEAERDRLREQLRITDLDRDCATNRMDAMHGERDEARQLVAELEAERRCTLAVAGYPTDETRPLDSLVSEALGQKENRIAELRQALEPFMREAESSGSFPDWVPVVVCAVYGVTGPGQHKRASLGDCRHAAKVWKETGS